MSASTLDCLHGIGEEVKIYTYLSVREDAMQLYGFLTKDDLDFFKLLIQVNGIGPKGALAILSVMTTDDLRFAILAADSKTISKAPGIGAKTAQRLIIDLKDKLEGDELNFNGNTESSKNKSKFEALSALEVLGIPKKTSEKIADRLLKQDSDISVEDLVKQILKNI